MSRLLWRTALAVGVALVASFLLYAVVIEQPLQDDRRDELRSWGQVLGTVLADQLAGRSPAEQQQLIDRVAKHSGWPIRVTAQPPVPQRPGHVSVRVAVAGSATPGTFVEIGPVALAKFARTQRMGSLSIVFDLALIVLVTMVLVWPLWRGHKRLGAAAQAMNAGDHSARANLPRRSPIKPLGDAFDSMAETTEATLNSQRDLLRAVSHELRTPIARLRFAIPAACEADSEKREQKLAEIDADLDELDDLVEEMLTFSRLAHGSADLQGEPIDVETCVRPIAERYDVAIDDSAAVSVIAVPRYLSRAIDNLIQNAKRHAAEHIRIRWRAEHDRAVIFVDDDGPGVPADQRKRIFEPFVRLANDDGHGIGLAIVDRVATSFGGRAWVEDSELGGASFAIELPRHV